jgi:hypothetical protein
MTDYRIYRIDLRGKAAGPPWIIWCENDAAALGKVQRHLGDFAEGYGVEIWEGSRRVSSISANYLQRRGAAEWELATGVDDPNRCRALYH